MHNNREKQAKGCIAESDAYTPYQEYNYYTLALTNLICVLFDPAIPTSSFNFIVFYIYLFILSYSVGIEYQH